MRDYAHKQGFNDKRPSSKKTARQEMAPAWGWTVLGIALGLGIAVLVAIKLFPKLVGIDRSLATPEELEQDDTLASSQSLAGKQLKTAETKSPPKPKFDFYTLLPNMEEVDIKEAKIAEEEKTARLASLAPPPVATPVSLTHVETPHQALPVDQKPDTFILQAAVFQSKQPAESLKAQLTLQGFEVKIEAYQKNSSPDTWYRVYLGPYPQESQAKLAQVSLQQTAQIDSFVIKSKA